MQKKTTYVERKVGLRGYTLVEMAMVLMVVAILIGGLFKGKEFIENAKLKTVINDFDHMTQAYYTYIQRTGHAPGLERGTDGHIVSDNIISNNFFQDLIAEGLVVAKAGGAIIINSYGGSWSVNTDGTTGTLELCSDSLPAFIVRGVDANLDDGVPDTGLVVTRDSSNVSFVSDYAVAAASDGVFTVCKAL